MNSVQKSKNRDKNGKKIFIWKRKRVTEAVYNQRLSQQRVGARKRKVNASPNLNSAIGRRIVDIRTLGENLKCSSCDNTLSLCDITEEKRCGLASLLTVKCNKCITFNTVSTDKKHLSKDNKEHFNVNTEAALGALHAGMGYTHLNKLLACVNVPPVDSKLFKRHEREVGPVIEEVAKESCAKWAAVERQLTIQNEQNIKALLPPDLQSGYIIKKNDSISAVPMDEKNDDISSTDTNNNKFASTCITNQPKDNSTNEAGEIMNGLRQGILSNETEATFDDVVRIIVSYDMGWLTRGTGRSYDSLFGQASIIGLYTGRVLEYITRSRKCRMCDRGHPKSDHDCRMNFMGSAKAMEPSGAVEAVTQSTILKNCNLEVGILIGDDDSSTIAAVRNVCDHQVIKHSDKNHTTKGVSKQLYKLQKDYKDVTGEVIDKLRRCFTYAVEQNKNQSTEMAAAIRNIPFHCFNYHDECGNWCKFKQNPLNYKPHECFQNPELFEDLKTLFNKLAANVNRFASGASSQANESLNNTMASKAPKARCYSLSESADFRYACAVSQKNIGAGYIGTVKEKFNLESNEHAEQYIKRIDKEANDRRLRAKKPEFKKRRLLLKKNKTMLRNRKEISEGTSYSSNMGLFNTQSVEINQCEISSIISESPPCIVFFDLETSSFSKTADILQIAAKCGDSTFSAYINPKQQVAKKATNANGLTNIDGNLMLNGQRVNSKPRAIVLQEFFVFLYQFKKKCILCAHNCKFDATRLVRALKLELLIENFGALIYGFVDTLPITRRITGKTGKGENTLTALASALSIPADGAHNALNDVVMLDEIVKKLKITEEELIANNQTWATFIAHESRSEQSASTLKTLAPLKDCVSLPMRKKMAEANISYDLLLETYRQGQQSSIKQLLGPDENNKVRVTKSSRVLLPIFEYFKKIFGF